MSEHPLNTELDDDFDWFFNNVYPNLDELESDHQFLLENALKRDRDMRVDSKGSLIIPLVGLSLKIIAFLFISKKGVFKILGSKKRSFALINNRSRKKKQAILIAKD